MSQPGSSDLTCDMVAGGLWYIETTATIQKISSNDHKTSTRFLSDLISFCKWGSRAGQPAEETSLFNSIT